MPAVPSSNAAPRCRRGGAEDRLPAQPVGQVDLAAMLADLAARGVNELHVEAGAKLNGSFVREDLVDEWLVTSRRACSAADATLAAFWPAAEPGRRGLRLQASTAVGPDLRLLLRRAGGETSTP